jgi:type-F conjugative transfer system pilin assembly protein TrbC
VYLKSTSRDCPGGQGSLSVSVDEGIGTLRVFTDGKLWNEQAVRSLDITDVNTFLERGDKAAETLKLPDLSKEKHAEDAKQIADKFYSQEFQDRIQSVVEDLKATVFHDVFEGYDMDKLTKSNAKGKGKLSSSERLYIFISSSIPVETLRNYVRALDKIKDNNIVMVMRGFVGGMKYIRPTIEFSKSILKKDPNCEPGAENCELYGANIEIDPLLFRKYAITRVPAFVYVPHMTVRDAGLSEGKQGNAEFSQYHVVYGDASLASIIEHLQKDAKSTSLDTMLTVLRR